MAHITGLVHFSKGISATAMRNIYVPYNYYQKHLLLLLLLLLYLNIHWFIFKLVISNSLFILQSLIQEHEQLAFRYFWKILCFLLSERCSIHEEHWKCKKLRRSEDRAGGNYLPKRVVRRKTTLKIVKALSVRLCSALLNFLFRTSCVDYVWWPRNEKPNT